MNEKLTLEQSYLLRRIALEARDLSREELINALLACWEGRFRQKQAFMESSRSAGYVFRLNEGGLLQAPNESDLEEVFGYVPTEEEAEDYMRTLWESATMELDMDEIVLESDD
tara:strand:+ start:22 stop:360 length:339 start_codon:yes stop_codon:yes gene_type:complete